MALKKSLWVFLKTGFETHFLATAFLSSVFWKTIFAFPELGLAALALAGLFRCCTPLAASVSHLPPDASLGVAFGFLTASVLLLLRDLEALDKPSFLALAEAAVVALPFSGAVFLLSLKEPEVLVPWSPLGPANHKPV